MAGQVKRDRTLNVPTLPALQRLKLIDATEPLNKLDALFNPSSLSLAIDATAGRLNPVGSSHPVKQYAYTNEAKFSLELYWSTYHVYHRGLQNIQMEPREALAWLASFCYPRQQGIAPAPLLVVWPNTLTMLVTVDSWKGDYLRWDADGVPRIARALLDVSELRQSPRYRRTVTMYGLHQSDDMHTSTAASARARKHLGVRGRGARINKIDWKNLPH